MFENRLHDIHNLQNELTGNLGVAANNVEVAELLDNARRVVNSACREVYHFQRQGRATAEISAQMTAAVDEVMNALTDKVAAIRKMTPMERRWLGIPKRPEPIHPAVIQHQEAMRQQALRDEAVAVLDEIESLGGYCVIIPAGRPRDEGGRDAVQVVGIKYDDLPETTRQALRGHGDRIANAIKVRQGIVN
jgi:hypothetical protein